MVSVAVSPRANPPDPAALLSQPHSGDSCPTSIGDATIWCHGRGHCNSGCCTPISVLPQVVHEPDPILVPSGVANSHSDF